MIKQNFCDNWITFGGRYELLQYEFQNCGTILVRTVILSFYVTSKICFHQTVAGFKKNNLAFIFIKNDPMQLPNVHFVFGVNTVHRPESMDTDTNTPDANI